MADDADTVLREALLLSQRMESLASQVAALAAASRDQSRRVTEDQAALRERMMRLETLIDASMLFSLRDRQAGRNERRGKTGDEEPPGSEPES